MIHYIALFYVCLIKYYRYNNYHTDNFNGLKISCSNNCVNDKKNMNMTQISEKGYDNCIEYIKMTKYSDENETLFRKERNLIKKKYYDFLKNINYSDKEKVELIKKHLDKISYIVNVTGGLNFDEL